MLQIEPVGVKQGEHPRIDWEGMLFSNLGYRRPGKKLLISPPADLTLARLGGRVS